MQEVADNFASPEQRDAITIRPGSQKVTVVADRNALRGALINLVENALQASTAEPRIELRAEEADDSVFFAVADNGRGIAPDALPRLFEPFFTTRPGGTGLGLAIVRAVADAHDGNVGVESGAQGTTFTLRLPKSGGRE
jgi:two-component system sensor histidine kinase FlrB